MSDSSDVSFNTTSKNIIIIDKVKAPNKLTKRLKCEKEKKMRVETKTWGLIEEDLSHSCQLESLTMLKEIGLNDKNKSFRTNDYIKTNKYIPIILTHLKNKLYNYKQQDLIKKRFESKEFVSLNETIELIKSCDLKCHYCSDEVYILYQLVRERKQWTLDRINNDLGHNSKNVVIACLQCNLKRRRTNKDAFMFTKNLIINKKDNFGNILS